MMQNNNLLQSSRHTILTAASSSVTEELLYIRTGLMDRFMFFKQQENCLIPCVVEDAPLEPPLP